jgi:hypothetical protein
MGTRQHNLRYGVILLVAIGLFFVLNSGVVSASTNVSYGLIISPNCPDYTQVGTSLCPLLNNYTIVGGTYDIWIFGTDLPSLNFSSKGFTLISLSNDRSTAHYRFTAPESINVSHLVEPFGIYRIPVWSKIGEFFDDNVTRLNLTVTENSSQVDFYMNLNGTSLDTLNITQPVKIQGSIANFLSSFDGQVEMKKGWGYPLFNSFNMTKSIDVTSMYFLINAASAGNYIPFTADEVNNNPSVLNNYIKSHSSEINSPSHIIFTKSGNDYTLWDDNGYGNVSNSYLNQIRNLINQSLVSVNIKDVADKIIPSIGANLSFLDNINLNYTIGAIDLNNVSLRDGNYTVAVFIRDPQGNNLTKTINLRLEGLTNVESGSTINNGTEYIPTLPEISYILKGIKGMNGSIKQMKIVAFDTINIPTPSGLQKVYKFLNISILNGTESNGTFFFTVNATNPGYVHMYVYNESTAKWDELNTTWLGGNNYSANTPHFSLFMIAEEAAPSNNNGGGGGGGGIQESQLYNNTVIPPIFTNPINYTNQTGEPINLGGNNNPSQPSGNSGITGAVIGALSSPGGIAVTLVLAIGIITLGIIIVIRKRGTGRRVVVKELNSGDRLGEA